MGKTKPELYCNILTSKNLCPYFESQPLSMLTLFSVACTLPLKLNPIFLWLTQGQEQNLIQYLPAYKNLFFQI